MIQYWHEKHREIKARRSEEGFDGFTLIELLIVIVVLGILAATVIFALGGVTSSSAQASCDSDAKSVEVAVTAFKNFPNNGDAWPAASTTAGVTFGATTPFAPTGTPTANATSSNVALTGGTNPYLRTFPNGNNTHYYIANSQIGGVYVFNVSTATWTNYDTSPDPCSTVQ